MLPSQITLKLYSVRSIQLCRKGCCFIYFTHRSLGHSKDWFLHGRFFTLYSDLCLWQAFCRQLFWNGFMAWLLNFLYLLWTCKTEFIRCNVGGFRSIPLNKWILCIMQNRVVNYNSVVDWTILHGSQVFKVLCKCMRKNSTPGRTVLRSPLFWLLGYSI